MLQYSVRSVHLYSTYPLYTPLLDLLCSNLYSKYALYTFTWRTLCTPLLDVHSVHLYLTYSQYTFTWRTFSTPLLDVRSVVCTPLLDVRSVHLYLTYALYTFIRRTLCTPLFNIIGYFCSLSVQQSIFFYNNNMQQLSISPTYVKTFLLDLNKKVSNESRQVLQLFFRQHYSQKLIPFRQH